MKQLKQIMNKTTQTTQFLYQQRKKNYETEPAQQKQRKQLILTDSKNVFT